MSFSSREFSWVPVSLAICYDFTGRKKKLDIPLDHLQIVPAAQDHVVQINLKEFDRHCLQAYFTIEVAFGYSEERPVKLRFAKYKADVS